MGMLPWSPLGGGWLSGKYTRDSRPTGATRLGEDPELLGETVTVALGLRDPFDTPSGAVLERYLAPFVLPERNLALLSQALETASPALMRAMAEHLKRQIVVGPRAGWEMDRDSVIARLIASVQPHPDIGKPRLWSHGAGDAAVRAMPWPLEKALCDYPEVAPAAVANTVVQLAPRGRQP